MDHSRPDRHDPPTHESSGTHAPEDALGTASPTSDGWLRTVLENTSDVICVLAPDGSFRYISPAVKWVLGYLPEDLIGRVGFDYVHIEDAAFAAESFAQILKSPGLHAPLQFRVQTADGSLRHVEAVPNNQLENPTLRGVVVTFRDLTERTRIEEKARFQARLLDAVGQSVIATDREGKIVYWNNASEELYGWSAEEVMSRSILDVALPEQSPDERKEIMLGLREGRSWSGEFELRRRDGTLFPAMVTTSPARDDRGNLAGIIGVSTDISERVQAEASFRETENRYRTLVEQIPAVTYIQEPIESDNPKAITYMSPQYETMLGYLPQAGMVDEEHWLRTLHPEDRERVLAEEARTDESGEPFRIEYRVVAADGRVVWVQDHAVLVRDEEGRSAYWLGVQFDITERKALEEQLHHQAFHDTLTGLPNRALFSDRLQHALSRTRRRGGKVAVLFMDLDNFKVINDSLGHKAGDELLVGVAERLRATLRTEDTAARLGGDEFAVLLEDLAQVGEATRAAERIAEQLRAPFDLGERETFVTASIGVAIGDTVGDTVGDTSGIPEWSERLLRDADLAMYRAKLSGKARYAVFEEAMSATALERLELSNDLRRALQREEFALHYQPMVSLNTGRAVGFEALVRWEHPERGQMLPGRFIPLAEETGLLAPIGQWVLREACTQAKEWQRQYPHDPPLVVCVNLSASQLRNPNLYQVIDQTLEETRLEPNGLNLEITESAAMEDAQATAVVLEALKGLGVRVIIDDFGTGYSSLSYLERFPVDYIKIDRSFVSKLGEEAGAKVLVKGMIDLVHALSLEVVAEGVETAGRLERLRDMGCDMAQGYYISRPLPSEAAASVLDKQHP